MELILASHNSNKVVEIKKVISGHLSLLSLKDIDWTEEIPETASTIEGNAKLKAEFVFNKLLKACIADDSGLEVDALNGEPGVYSARYAGVQSTDHENVLKVLASMADKTNRKANFKTVIALKLPGESIKTFTGIVHGTLTHEERGTGGFGYDSIFIPDGWSRTFAQVSMEEKNAISHRGRAIAQLAEYLTKEQLS